MRIINEISIKEDQAGHIFIEGASIKKSKNIILKALRVIRKSRPRAYDTYDHYWIIRSIWQGYLKSHIEKAIEAPVGSIGMFLKRKGIEYYSKTTIFNYGVSDIARELGVSRQAIHQKIKKCQNPYIKLPLGRPKKGQKDV